MGHTLATRNAIYTCRHAQSNAFIHRKYSYGLRLYDHEAGDWTEITVDDELPVKVGPRV